VSRREKKRERTKTEILDAAVKLFTEKGYDGTSVDDVAELADLAKGTIYYHFEGKEELLLGLSLRYQAEVAHRVEDRLKAGEDSLQVLRDILSEFATNTSQFPEVARSYYAIAFKHICHDDYKDDPATIPNIFTSILQCAQKQNTVRNDIDARELSIVLTGVFHQSQVTWLMLEEDRSLTEKIHSWLDLWLEGANPPA
jgi:AcrR family transcriptional regulator